MSKIEGSIPMKPWLAKFARKIENLAEHEPVNLSHNSYIAKIIKLFLTGKTKLKTSGEKNRIGEEYSGSLRYSIAYSRNLIFITPTGIRTINKLLFCLFHEMLLSEILMGQRYGIDQKEIIENFLERYGIEIEIDVSYDTIKKANFRMRESKKIASFRGAKCPKLQRSDFQRVA